MGADRTLVFPTRPAIVSAASIAGPKEGQGPLGAKFDVVLEEDLLGQISWEMAESEMLRRTVELCCQKGGIAVANVQALLSGDLNNQIIASTFAARALGTPFLGLYGACSTFVEALILGAMLVDGGYRENAMAAACSHFCTAERQFRNPLELGTQRPPSAQWTATAAGAVLLARRDGAQVCVANGTLGRVVDRKIRDANHMGAVMAPAVCDTICAHFAQTDTDAGDYDRVVTGDLGVIGRELLLELLRERGVDMPEEKLTDCGASLYYDWQDAHAGGSGAGCIAATTCARLLDEVREGAKQRLLLVGSGALLSWTSAQQGESIPGIAFAATLEGK